MRRAWVGEAYFTSHHTRVMAVFVDKDDVYERVGVLAVQEIPHGAGTEYVLSYRPAEDRNAVSITAYHDLWHAIEQLLARKGLRLWRRNQAS